MWPADVSILTVSCPGSLYLVHLVKNKLGAEDTFCVSQSMGAILVCVCVCGLVRASSRSV